MINDTVFTWSGDISEPEGNATIEEIEEAIANAEEYLSQAREMESIARSCQRGWGERLVSLRGALGRFEDK